ncbi:choline dehydrogenase [Roseomonas hellenica]|uniref:Choline dehydrogenase n=1 Tax=Plastoroseomonas hellenica TaxID=2687306 RepID=A0ABS5EYG2_9PROT|nr:GMC family oxidoreductase N-terminal domain-containing protein [Plastoroseomonas hellenica]MBR0665323.1 choline dehydrogenase [Plastoroseomonas hellenica]
MSAVEADFVIAGGGSAGCILAARLSEDPTASVILLEAGPPDRDMWIHVPMGYAKLFGSGRYDWRYETEPEPGLENRRIHWPRGKVLGGSGSVNGLVFLRGSPRDFDRWAQAGARGWGWDEVEPVFRALETWEGPPSEGRGTTGPVHVCAPKMSRAAAAFIDACANAGLPRNRDWNNGQPIDGAGPVQLNTRRGRRSSTAREYLKPAMGRPNLQVVTGAIATRILVENGRATGITAMTPGGERTYTARRQVVVSAGAIETPKLLMLSGIGDGAHLAEMGIETRLHAPGVGQNLQDHLIAKFILRTSPCGTINEIMRNPFRQAGMGLGYLLARGGPLAIGAGEANAFARVTPGAEEAEVQLLFINFAVLTYQEGLLPHPGIMFNFGQCRPDSRGRITLRSPDIADKPVIRANYLDHPNDVRVMIEAAKLSRRVIEQQPLAGLIEGEIRPGKDARDDDAYLRHIRATASTVFHPCGTVRMGSDDLAPLDPELRFKGIDGLTVADASAFPLIPSPNIQPAVMMLAERAAGFLRRR